ncbi:hypothetical protein [Flavobacterium sp.]|uniref:hypothetical protein n=1 Tax=Flavobacterium sp. TaxID=239 RepID=UPI00260F36D8|nr:hypothetical protein [Flavobacterium sp.]
MKKIIAIVTMLLAFTVSVNAQDKKVSSQEAAQKDIAALSAKVTMSENLKKDLTTLMVMKHDALNDAALTPEQKEHAREGYERKLLTGLNKEQRETLMKYPELLKKVTH